MFKTVVASALLIAGAQARCPSDCSGKGTCGEHDLCTCYPGYQGLDCSERTCLFGRAWGDVVSGEGLAHDYSECSGNGECDRKTGECTCYDGFTGDACRYSSCPNSCSGHGTCEFISEIATDGTVQYGSHPDRGYDLWDAKKSRFCKCDAYWSGADCSARMCPKGNDPLTTMSSDDLGGNTAEVQEVQTVTIRPQLLKNNFGAYVAIGGDFTLTYTDAYNQEWTTRPIRVTTVVQETAGASEIAYVHTGTKITDTQRRFFMFEQYDVVEITGFAHPTVDGKPLTQTITSIDCTSIAETACSMTLSPGFTADEAAAGGNDIKVTLVNADTGEIGVKRMLQELPGQVVPSITVDETIGRDYNTFKITFSDAANSGDQHALKCKAAACDSDGCQPRKKSIKGLFRYAATLVTDSPATANAQVTDAANGLANFRTAAQGGSYVQIIGTTVGVGGGTASAPVSVAAGALEWTGDTTLTVPGLSGTAANHKGLGTQAVPLDMTSASMALYQIHDFDADSTGHKTGGIAGDWTNPLGVATATNAAANNIKAKVPSTTVPGPHLLTAGTEFGGTGFQNFVAGDRIWISCSDSTISPDNGYDGYYKIVSIAATHIAFDRALPFTTDVDTSAASQVCTAKKIVDTVCEVEETVKGTSENVECSNRGNCDTQTGLCGCFAGYTGEDCSVQTVLV